MPAPVPRRVLVLGCGGAGKSTLARRLGAALDLPVVHLDRIFWQSGWVPLPEERWRAAQRELVAEPGWVLDGNYGAGLDLRLPAADLVILLDPPRRVCLRRAVLRYLRHRGTPVQAPGCPERLSRDFVRWIWRWPREGRVRTLRRIATHGQGTRQVLLRTRREVTGFLREQTGQPVR